MTDFLKSIGLGATSADPAALLNQQTVDAQTKTIKAQLTSLFNSVDLSAKTGQLLGVPQAYIDKLGALRDKVKSYIDMPNISPTELYNKLKSLDADYKALLAEQEKKVDDTRMQKARAAVTAVRARVVEIEADTTTSKGLREDFQALLVDAEDMLKKMEASLAAARDIQNAAVTGGTTSTTLETLFPKISISDSFFQVSPDSITDRLRMLNIRKEAEEEKEFSPVRAVKRFFLYFKTNIWYITLICGGILGGSVLSNFYIDEPSALIKIFYFIVGAALFPFALALGLVSPPYRHSYLIPLVEIGVQPAAAAASTPDAPPAPPDVQKGGAEVEAPSNAATDAVTVDQNSVGWFESLYKYEPVTQAVLDLRLNDTKRRMQVASGVSLLATAGVMYWNDFFSYLINGEASSA